MTEQLAQFLDTAAPIQQALAQPETDAVVANLEAGRCHIFTSGRPTQVQDLPQGLGLSAGAVGTFGPWRVEVFGRQMVVFERVRMPEEPRGEGAQGLLARIESELGGHLVTQGPLLAEALLQWIGQRLGQIHPRALILHVGDFPAPLEGVMHLGAVGSDFVPGLDAATRQLERLCARADVILWASPSDDTSQWLRTLGRATVWTTGPKAPYGTWTATLEEDGEGRVQVTALSHDVSLTPMDAPKASPPPSEEEGPEEEGQDDEAKVPEEEPPTLPQRSLAPEADEVQEDTTKEEAAQEEAKADEAEAQPAEEGAVLFLPLDSDQKDPEPEEEAAQAHTTTAQRDYHLQESDDDMRETMEAPESQFRRALEEFDAVHQRVTSESAATRAEAPLAPASEGELQEPKTLEPTEALEQGSGAAVEETGEEDLPLVEVEPLPLDAEELALGPPDPQGIREPQRTHPEIQFVLDSGEFDAFDSDEEFEQSIALDEDPAALLFDPRASDPLGLAPTQDDLQSTRSVSNQLFGVLPEDTVDELTLSQEMRAILHDPAQFSLNDVFEEISSAVVTSPPAEPSEPEFLEGPYDADRTPTANVPGNQLSEALASFEMLEEEEELSAVVAESHPGGFGGGRSSFSSPRIEIERPVMPPTLESPTGTETTKQVTRESVSSPSPAPQSFDMQNPPRLTWGADEQTAQREMAQVHPKMFEAVNQAAAQHPEVPDSEGSKLSVLSKRLKALRERRQQLSGEHRAIPRQDND